MRTRQMRAVGVALAIAVAATLACHAPGWEPEAEDPTATATNTLAERPPTSTPRPTETPAPTATEASSGDVTGPDGCAYDSLFVDDVTVPDNTEMSPRESFTKIWRIRNSGTCPWEAGTRLVFLADERMDGPGATDVEPADPDQAVDLRVDLIAPESAGPHRSTWRMQTQDGRWFGDRVFVKIDVVTSPTPTATPTQTVPISPTVAYTVPHPFDGAWAATGGEEGDLGYPIDEARTNHTTAEQEFEGGLMYWRQAFDATPHHVFVLTRAGASLTTGTWARHVDTWREGDEELSCPGTSLPWGPVRGFGLIWCDNSVVQTSMGNPVGGEVGSKAGFQKFSGGTLLWSSTTNHVYALLSDGTWQRFLVTP